MRKRITMNYSIVPVGVLALALTVLLAPVLSEAGDDLQQLRQDIESIKMDTETIKKQLLEIKNFLSQRVAQADRGPVTMNVGEGPMLGRADAPVTMIEFSDYECPFCRKYFSSTFQELKKAYIDTGKVRYIFRDFPLERIHPDARLAAEAAHCAGDQGKYWEMHDRLFTHQGAKKPDTLKSLAGDMKLDLTSFEVCLDNGKYAKAVNEHIAAGSAAGVTGTPGFFIGKTQEDNTIVATGMKGAQPAAVFSQVIDGLLDQKATH